MVTRTRAQILEGLDAGQRAAVLHGTGPALVTAVAGAGKTTAIVARVEDLVSVRGVDPNRILAVTFSKKGAEEMQARLKARGLTGSRVGTFHSLAWEIVRTHEQGWTLDDRGRYEIIVKEVVGYKGMRWDSADHDLLCNFIGLCKAWLAAPDDDYALELAQGIHAKGGGNATFPEKMLEAYDRAERARLDARLMTFDDMLVRAVEILESDAQALARWQVRWDYMIQDEAQDQNLAQARLGELLTAGHRNYMLVGDRSQTIFSWRGADQGGLEHFARAQKAAEITLDHTYRCPTEVVEAANNVLMWLGGQVMVPRAGAPAGRVTVDGFQTFADEAESIVEHIELERGGRAWSSMVVLYRTSEQARAIEAKLIAAKIPYRVIGGISFYERKEILNVLSYLRLAAGRGGVKDVERSLRSPFRFLGVATIEKVVSLSKDPNLTWEQIAERAVTQDRQRGSLRSWARVIERAELAIHAVEADTTDVDAGWLLQVIVQSTGYLDYLKKEEGDDTPENNRVKNVTELVEVAKKFPTADAFLDYVDATVKAEQAARRKGPGESDAVTLCTIHRAKGLEWPVVFVAGVCDGLFPHAKAEISEERRLLYVAVTRAKERLYISSVEVKKPWQDDGESSTPAFIRLLGYGAEGAQTKTAGPRGTSARASMSVKTSLAEPHPTRAEGPEARAMRADLSAHVTQQAIGEKLDRLDREDFGGEADDGEEDDLAVGRDWQDYEDSEGGPA